MSDNVINVGLYGGKSIFGGREQPLEASIVSCSMANECSFYKEGKCLNVRSVFSEGCNFGSVRNVKGYTSRAQKYRSFKSKWVNHEKYSKLEYPNKKLGVIGDEVVLGYSYISLDKDTGKFKVPFGMGTKLMYIKREEFNNDFIYNFCKFKPQALMGGSISDFQEKEVPLFLSHLREVLPEQYESFIKEYPEFNFEIDYVGRKVLLKSLKPCEIKVIGNYNEVREAWKWDGEYLTRMSGKIGFISVARNYELVELKIKPDEDTIVKVSDNSQVDEDTVFID